jgi:hypothetical protein
MGPALALPNNPMLLDYIPLPRPALIYLIVTIKKNSSSFYPVWDGTIKAILQRKNEQNDQQAGNILRKK